MSDNPVFTVGERVSVLSWSLQAELFTPVEKPPTKEIFDDDEDENGVIVIALQSAELWRNPLTRDSYEKYEAEVLAVDERGYCTVYPSVAFRSDMAYHLYKQYEDAQGKLPYPKTEEYTKSYLLSPHQLVALGPWTAQSRSDFLFGKGRPHTITSLKHPFNPETYCQHDAHKGQLVNVTRRIMINYCGGVYEHDVCAEHAGDDGWCFETWSWNGSKNSKSA